MPHNFTWIRGEERSVRPSEQTAKDFLSQVDGSGFYLENTSLGGFL